MTEDQMRQFVDELTTALNPAYVKTLRESHEQASRLAYWARMALHGGAFHPRNFKATELIDVGQPPRWYVPR